MSLAIRILGVIFFYIFASNSHASWYDSNVAGTAPDWSYRVPINIPAGTVANSTVKVDVNFSTLLTTLGESGTLDQNSIRIVKSDHATLLTTQEYSDRIFNDILDAANNNQGQIKFINEETGATTYFLYFDTTASGSKPANPQATINGNFENSAGSTPSDWVTSAVNANGAQNNEVHDTAFTSTYSTALSCSDGSITNADDSPNNSGTAASTTGRKWQLLGYRNNCEDGASGTREIIQLTKTFDVPATSPGNLTFYFQLQAFDDIGYDFFQIQTRRSTDASYSNINHTSLGINNTGGTLTINTNAIGRSSGFGSSLVDAGWKLATFDLSPFAGTTLSFRFTTNSATDNVYRSWVKIDDVEWSIATATLGTPEKSAPKVSLQKQLLTLSDPVNGNTNPKSIPGAVVQYTLTASNAGNRNTDTDSLELIDGIPANTILFVNDLGGGIGPVQYTDGSPGSGLTYTYTSLSATTDDVSFSDDGAASFSYIPVPDANGFDSAVTHIKISPKGQFLQQQPSGTPSFDVKFRVKIQ